MPGRPHCFARSLATLCLTLVLAAAMDCTSHAWASPQPPAPPPAGQPPPPPPPPGERPLRVFIDCTNAYCDTEFFQSELAFIDHVRDRRDADVHVLVTVDTTGGGGSEYTFAFLGLGRFDKVTHTLRCVTTSTNTDDERRREMVTTLKLGLVRYVADTPAGRQLQIGYRRPSAASGGAAAKDPWDHWVFTTSLRGSTSGESSQTSVSLYGGFSANRVTEAWRVLTSASVNYSQSDYTFSEGDTYTSISRSYTGSALVVRSLGRHWGAGIDTSVSSSTYSNYHSRLRAAPAVEYNVFPYSESTRRQLTLNYGLGLVRNDYFETTIYGKDRETLASHALTVLLDMRQPWGSTSTVFQASQYLNDLSKSRFQVYGDVDVRLFKGFSLSVYGSVSRIRDQLNLPMGAATPEEVLVRKRQLATSYSYYMSMGISYRFGSIFNNVVNTRFNGIRQM